MSRLPLRDLLATKTGTPAPRQNRPARIATSVRIDPGQLQALKIIAAKRRVRVNDLVIQGIEYILATYEGK